VPTQLQRLLQNPVLTSWLSQFETVLLGGAPAWSTLLEQARRHGIRLAPTYGMTETASQIATLKPEDFQRYQQLWSGFTPCESNYSHFYRSSVRCKSNRNHYNRSWFISTGLSSIVYGPEYFQVDDLGFFDSQGYLNVIGRSSNKIITGENVFPSEVESAIRATQLVWCLCNWRSHQQWGQVVTAIYVPSNSALDTAGLQAILEDNWAKASVLNIGFLPACRATLKVKSTANSYCSYSVAANPKLFFATQPINFTPSNYYRVGQSNWVVPTILCLNTPLLKPLNYLRW